MDGSRRRQLVLELEQDYNRKDVANDEGKSDAGAAVRS